MIGHIELHSDPAAPMHIESDDARLARIPQLFVELLRTCSALNSCYADDRATRKAAIPNLKKQIKDIGRHLYKLGSHPCMQMASYYIQACWAQGMFGATSDPDGFHPSEINILWDGIGVWKA